jgi:protoporphyrinogen oxidase
VSAGTPRIVIVGAGPTGLGAAHRLHECGARNWTLLEGAPHAGGLASSFTDPRGFTWDVGGHVQFSHYEYFDRVMLECLGNDGWLHHRREAFIWICGRFIPYPLQNNIRHLPPAALEQCLLGLASLARSPHGPPANFGEWIDGTFGPGLAEIFLRPYNEKVWAYPPELLSAAWCADRVAVPDVATVMHSLAEGTDDTSWGPNSTFAFPRRGGTGAIWRACAERLPADALRFNARLTRLDLDRRVAVTEGGETFPYDALISTMPLRELIKVSGQLQLWPLAERGLLYSTTHVVGLGLQGRPRRDVADKCWMYFPEDNCPFYRATVFSNYSPHNVPDIRRHWSLMLEVSDTAHKPVDRDRLLEEVIDGALNTRLIERREDIVSTWSYRADYGYPTPGLHRDDALAGILPVFEAADVYSRGRFGSWKYEVSNQDHSFMQGVEVVERLLNGRAEITVADPSHANAAKHTWPFERWTTRSGPASSRPADARAPSSPLQP